MYVSHKNLRKIEYFWRFQTKNDKIAEPHPTEPLSVDLKKETFEILIELLLKMCENLNNAYENFILGKKCENIIFDSKKFSEIDCNILQKYCYLTIGIMKIFQVCFFLSVWKRQNSEIEISFGQKSIHFCIWKSCDCVMGLEFEEFSCF